MKNLIILIAALTLNLHYSYSQSFEMDGSEIGFDVAFSASNQGGNVGIGLKYGLNFGEYLIVGPSVRYERLWFKNITTAQEGGYNIYGGGAFAHARFFNALFVGAEFEMLRSPFGKDQFAGFITNTGSWAPTLFLGGGFSMEFNEAIRINAGIMYDVINAQNSPFQRSYFLQKKTEFGQPAGYLPVIYRIAFFIPLS
ncbi:MAG: hypothetical protein MK105_17000 [Crocinitomicaceae bacterium]|nr:hypothetical protein [Crocinitomicaceae bacterium]